MQTHHTDVIIHTRKQLDDNQFSEVARQVKDIEGVVEFVQNKDKPNFIMVAYNAQQTKALSILNKLTRLGFNARLIGI